MLLNYQLKTAEKKLFYLAGSIKKEIMEIYFLDLRDNFGTTQCIVEKDKPFFKQLEKIQLESVIKVNGIVSKRTSETINKDLKTGEIEIYQVF